VIWLKKSLPALRGTGDALVASANAIPAAMARWMGNKLTSLVLDRQSSPLKLIPSPQDSIVHGSRIGTGDPSIASGTRKDNCLTRCSVNKSA
jgi:hypothetical protein